MNQTDEIYLSTAAAQELVEWKSLFATEVQAQARLLAMQSDDPSLITLEHFRAAAHSALPILEAAIQGSSSSDDQQQAA